MMLLSNKFSIGEPFKSI